MHKKAKHHVWLFYQSDLVSYGALGQPAGAYLARAVVEHVQVPMAERVQVTVAVPSLREEAALLANAPAIVPVVDNTSSLRTAAVGAVPAVVFAGAVKLKISEPVQPKSQASLLVLPLFKQSS